MDDCRARKDHLRDNLDYPGHASTALCFVRRRSLGRPANMLGHSNGRIPAPSSFEVRLELGCAVHMLPLIFGVWIEGSGVAGGIEGIRAMKIGGSQGNS